MDTTKQEKKKPYIETQLFEERKGNFCKTIEHKKIINAQWKDDTLTLVLEDRDENSFDVVINANGGSLTAQTIFSYPICKDAWVENHYVVD